MGNFKIKVDNEAESNEVQYLFEVIGYERGACSLGSYPAIIVTTQDWATGNYCSTRALGLDIPAHESYKEITLSELRDMVVLKRNDKNDRNVIDPEYDDVNLYLDSKSGLFVFHLPTQTWKESNLNNEPEVLARLQPIEKTMNTLNNEHHEQPTINDQYAERQHRHYFIDVSDVDEIDFYEIALRYNVTDPCIQHILKKCLAVGQRGQKDFHHDLKDIHDTAKRMLDVHGLDS